MPSDDMRSRTSQATLASMVCASSSLLLLLVMLGLRRRE
jgi:hypothetical protein